jgi:hypothetical protein
MFSLLKVSFVITLDIITISLRSELMKIGVQFPSEAINISILYSIQTESGSQTSLYSASKPKVFPVKAWGDY